MKKDRLQAFSDGFFAIIITVMVLDLKVPTGTTLRALMPLAPVFLNYALSFLYLGIYWNNHHHLLQVPMRVNGSMLWANLHLLFWLSLFPFVTGWMGSSDFAPLPSAIYGLVLLAAALAYWVLQHRIVTAQGATSRLKTALGKDWKGKLSPILYATGILSTLWMRGIAQALYLTVALFWLIPDRRIERMLEKPSAKSSASGPGQM